MPREKLYMILINQFLWMLSFFLIHRPYMRTHTCTYTCTRTSAHPHTCAQSHVHTHSFLHQGFLTEAENVLWLLFFLVFYLLFGEGRGKCGQAQRKNPKQQQHHPPPSCGLAKAVTSGDGLERQRVVNDEVMAVQRPVVGPSRA